MSEKEETFTNPEALERIIDYIAHIMQVNITDWPVSLVLIIDDKEEFGNDRLNTCCCH